MSASKASKNANKDESRQAFLDAQSDSYSELPSRLELAIDLFTKRGGREFVGSVHSRSIRIPSIENFTIEALADYSGLSINRVIVQLLEVALDEVVSGFSDEERSELFEIRGKKLAALNEDREFEQAQPGEA